MRSVLPTREFLVDIALVGIACLALVCSWFPVEPVIVASWQDSDGKRVERRVEGLGQNAEKIRHAVIAKLTRPRSASVGIMRWQQETSQFYADATAAAASNASVFRQVSHASPSPDGDRAVAWQAYWQDRATRSEQWLQERASEQARVVASFSESLTVSTIEPLIPDQRTAALGFAIALSAMLLGCVWRGLSPARRFVDEASESLLLPPASPEPTNTETAAMSFRAAWVQIRQPPIVRLRQACGWAIVLSAIISMTIRLTM
ncbi:hypothetical protein [Neorhodopirellula pilleata]|uniref:Uncharacterized protein n=1 Tax=Neorhodopirellula pilleata TaxID=2714738 RepID=A0A5C6A2M7_9BACT|nr:hypothetical protein [Neorhodopirellula pilleata]TWT94154.1 hypothetical protein Pla100_37630 [Neorhodopirellula pilleata]